MRWLFNLKGRVGAACHLLKTFENFFAIKENKMQPAEKPHGYQGLSYDRPALQAAMRKAYDSLIDFVTTDAFKTLMEDLGALHPIHRPKFVFDVLLSDKALAARGIKRPENILIQRSAFGDRRPTIFVVKRFLPEEFSNVWQNVNITFDNQFIESTVKARPRYQLAQTPARLRPGGGHGAGGRARTAGLNAPTRKDPLVNIEKNCTDPIYFAIIAQWYII